MEMTYTYWQSESGGYLGYWNDYPEFWTQGKTESELKAMLLSLYEDIQSDKRLRTQPQRHTGTMRVETAV